LYTCLSQKTLVDKIKMGMTLLRHQNGQQPGTGCVEAPEPVGAAT
jgi:hypothetical protein